MRNVSDILNIGRIVAFVAAGVIFLAALIDSLLFFGVTAGHPPNPLFFDFDYRSAVARLSASTALDQSFLEASWSWNVKAFPSMLVSDFLLASGLFCIAFVSWILTKAYRSSGGLAAKIMFLFFCFGAIVPAIGFLQNLGSTSAGANIYEAYMDPKNQYKEYILVPLQISFLMSLGRSVWIQALLYVLLGGGFWFAGFLGLVHSSEQREKRLPRSFRWHSIFSFVVGFAGFLVFMADVSKFFFVSFYGVYGFFTVIYLVLLVPAWVVWLGIIITWIPSDFMKGAVVVSGPAYAQLGTTYPARAEEASVEMEERPHVVLTPAAAADAGGMGGLEDENPEVVEIDLE